MGLRFRKSVKLGKHSKINFNKDSVSFTVGTKGMHYTVNSKGRTTKSVGIPGTGLYYSESSSNKSAAEQPVSNGQQTPYLNTKGLNPIAYFIITFFLGFLGVHHFIDGKIGKGILYLFTLGICGIGWIVDCIISFIAIFSKPTSQEQSSNVPQTGFEQSENFEADTLNTVNNATAEMKFYQKTWFIILILFLFPPIGIYLLWKEHKFNNSARIAVTVLFVIYTVFIIFSFSTNSENNTSNISQTTTEITTYTTTTELTTEVTTQTTTEPTTETTTKSTTTTTTTKKSGRTVYVTPNGQKYHFSKSCAGKNARERDLNEVKDNYQPCKKCAS